MINEYSKANRKCFIILGNRLHTDFELVYDMEVNEDGSASCGDVPSDCETADTLSLVEKYAAVSF